MVGWNNYFFHFSFRKIADLQLVDHPQQQDKNKRFQLFKLPFLPVISHWNQYKLVQLWYKINSLKCAGCLLLLLFWMLNSFIHEWIPIKIYLNTFCCCQLSVRTFAEKPFWSGHLPNEAFSDCTFARNYRICWQLFNRICPTRLQNRRHGFSDLPRILHVTSMALNCRWCKGAICTLFHNFFQICSLKRPPIFYPRSVITLAFRFVIKWGTNVAEAIFANFWGKELLLY